MRGSERMRDGNPSWEDVLQYIAATSRASTRSRFVLLVLVIASSLSFTAAWNSRQESWFNARLAVFEEAKNLQIWKDAPDESLSFQQKIRFHDLKKAFPTYDSPLIDLTREELYRTKIHQVQTLNIPFLGIGFDVNDLGMVAGLAFSVILLWFRFALSREVDNITIVFWAARDMKERCYLRRAYKLLSMEQVMTVPNLGTGNEGRFWKNLPKGLLFMPLMVQAFVVANDYMTFGIGSAVNARGTALTFSVECVLFLVISLLTYNCFALLGRTDEVWAEMSFEAWPRSFSPEQGAQSGSMSGELSPEGTTEGQ